VAGAGFVLIGVTVATLGNLVWRWWDRKDARTAREEAAQQRQEDRFAEYQAGQRQLLDDCIRSADALLAALEFSDGTPTFVAWERLDATRKAWSLAFMHIDDVKQHLAVDAGLRHMSWPTDGIGFEVLTHEIETALKQLRTVASSRLPFTGLSDGVSRPRHDDEARG